MVSGLLVPPPGIEPVSLALEGRFLTTGSPGKSLMVTFKGLLAVSVGSPVSLLHKASPAAGETTFNRAIEP